MEDFEELDEAFDEVKQAIYKLNRLIEKKLAEATRAPKRRCDTQAQAQGAHVQDAQPLKQLRRKPSDSDDDLLALIDM